MTSSTKYEYCTCCDANLTLQKGYRNDLPYWVCRGCGMMLINPSIDGDVIWICDKCEAALNIQEGFDERLEEWACTECGFVNKIDSKNVFKSEDEYQATLKNPYRGLSDEAVLELYEYQEESLVGGREDVLLVRHGETNRLFIKKLLAVYDKSVYLYLMEHPVLGMPHIIKLFESKNCLIVIEEYIEGKTVFELLENAPLTQEEAVNIAKNICTILDRLHTLNVPIIHRDVKPSNIIINDKNEVFLLDVNAAKWFDLDKTDDTVYIGTPYFAAPEQAGYGLMASSPKSDIYAVGILLNVMLTQKLPKEKRAEGKIWKIISKCISLEASERYTAKQLVAELERL